MHSAVSGGSSFSLSAEDLSAFERDEFSAASFVAEYRRRMPLQELQGQLQSHLDRVRQQLVTLINENYGDFIQLSAEMKRVGAMVEDLEASLGECRGFADSLQGGVASMYKEGARLLEDRGEARREREATLRFMSVERETEEIGNELSEGFEEAGGGGLGGTFSSSFSRLLFLENGARSLRQLKRTLRDAEMDRVKGIGKAVSLGAQEKEKETLFGPLEERVSQLQDALLAELAVSLDGILQRWLEVGREEQAKGRSGTSSSSDEISFEKNAAASVCRALAATGREEQVYSKVFEIFVKRELEAAAAKAAELSGPSAANKGDRGAGGDGIGGTQSLIALLDAVEISLLSERVSSFPSVVNVLTSPVLPAPPLIGDSATATGEGSPNHLAVPSLFLLSRCLMVPLIETIQKVCPSIFLPASPQRFVDDFRRVRLFFLRLVRRCSAKEGAAFLSSQGWRDLQSRWKVSALTAMRMKEAREAAWKGRGEIQEGGGGGVSFFSSGKSPAERTVLGHVLWSSLGVASVRAAVTLLDSPPPLPVPVAFSPTLSSVCELLGSVAAMAEAFARQLLKGKAGVEGGGAEAAGGVRSQQPEGGGSGLGGSLRFASGVNESDAVFVVADTVAAARMLEGASASSSASPSGEGGGLEDPASPSRSSSWGALRQLVFRRLEETESACREANPLFLLVPSCSSSSSFSGLKEGKGEGQEPSLPPASSSLVKTEAKDLLQLAESEKARWEDVNGMTHKALDETARRLTSARDVLMRTVLDQEMTEIGSVLDALRGVPAVYRMTNKPAPSRPSAYVAVCADTLRKLQKKMQKALEDSDVRFWMSVTIERLAATFAEKAVELLEGVERQEGSLQRLRGRAGPSTGNEDSDTDKIFKQIDLDVTSLFGVCEEEFGVDEIDAPQVRECREKVEAVKAIRENRKKGVTEEPQAGG
uniref:Conserved oligomeric Golgi complex subunit 2 n=1 Tax=Chromera velia CCMP2878 TaxID=1169474 RepID=A0A0G4G0N5_9ALVE|eukprot:Cvel_19623.t1-p1 / transcript=Cvel_19623.t1 / gene=Cvel_19623 / organism=Chromera_velia_CCMP2878 / gene_product=Conserved oligomeric Golgi complex subunit 2, putative / transcript_product=Conserved oligomeric Golgi complex subunit 2, putative / location=Cvel_scaffold1707:9220-19164(+) / protein_length=934 / sequence_SO=supercontig / SO=protein_coding / is_pseudo=false